MAMAKGEAPVGRNTVSGQALLSFIERIERIREMKKECADDEKLVFAELKAAGFRPATVRDVLKRRAAKPADVEDAETMLDQYLHAIGMRQEPPLFRYFGLSDSVTREQSIEALKLAVPPGGEIIVRGNGTPVRIWRDDKGGAHVEDYVEAPKPASRPEGGASTASRPPREIQDVDEAGAFELGKTAYQANQPITSNPFPWNDKRRPQFDAGWREASGSDGMGPET